MIEAVTRVAPAAPHGMRQRDFSAGWQAALDAVRDARDDTVRLIEDLTDPGECWFDHHGYCQEHGWMGTDPPCPHARAKRFLAEIGARHG